MPGRIFGNTITLLSNTLDLRAARQRLLSSNIANQETPGYKAKDIDFEAELKKRESASLFPAVSPGVTNAAHIPVAAARTPAPRPVTRPGESAGYDANTVGVDAEMVRLSENSLMYNIASKMLRSKFNMLMTAIREGGR